ncbi:hypothetical protein BDR05DRAFT_949626 [Suillus weaverae]|nr:hypothetical protein BDR05DRAFT_949626 [Suillus weaverae]
MPLEHPTEAADTSHEHLVYLEVRTSRYAAKVLTRFVAGSSAIATPAIAAIDMIMAGRLIRMCLRHFINRCQLTLIIFLKAPNYVPDAVGEFVTHQISIRKLRCRAAKCEGDVAGAGEPFVDEGDWEHRTDDKPPA